jgi:hypothetical protein
LKDRLRMMLSLELIVERDDVQFQIELV